MLKSTKTKLTGGSLYALGLIHARTQSGDKKDYLLEQLDKAGPNEILQHGACLGLGLVGMGSQDLALAEKINEIVMSESAGLLLDCRIYSRKFAVASNSDKTNITYFSSRR